MKKANRRMLLLVLIVALLTIPTAGVFAKELGFLTISGPGIKGEKTIRDPGVMMDLERSGFFDQASLSKMPQGLGEGYQITAHLNLDGKMVPFVQMEYYPMEEGESAYVHYTGRLEGEALQAVDEWRRLSPAADGTLRDVLTANNITVQPALVKAPAAPAKEAVSEPAAVPAASPVPTSYLIPGLVVGLLALMALALAARRRTVRQPTG